MAKIPVSMALSLTRRRVIHGGAMASLGTALGGRSVLGRQAQAATPEAASVSDEASSEGEPQPMQTADESDDLLPVSVVQNGFTPEQAADLHARYTFAEGLKAEDVTLFEFLNFGELLPVTMVPRSGNVVMLESAPDGRIGQTRFDGTQGELTLDEYLVHPASRAQGMIVVHQCDIVLEQYPGMREYDYHLWASNAKTTNSLLVAMLEADGKVDVQQPLASYVPALSGTAWDGIPVIDVLDMASGLDVEENEETRNDPNAVGRRLFLAESGEPGSDGATETMLDVLRSAPKQRESGQVFQYSSANTQALVLLIEAVEAQRWADVFRDRVWSRMTVEGDATMGVTPEGTAVGHGLLSSRLRDMARYGMLYTPSWDKAARERLVSEEMLQKIQQGGRPEIYLEGSFGKRMAGSFAGDVPVANSYQWDAVFADGDFFKSGIRGQGLYVSPGKDLVIGWFSTVMATDLTHYARTIARLFPGVA